LPCFWLSLQTYFPELYEKTKQIQARILHDELAAQINWDDVEAEFKASATLPVLNPDHPIALTTDLWTGADHESYICLTGHYFTKNWELQRILLDIYLCTDRHTGENLADWIKQVLSGNEINVSSFSMLVLTFRYMLFFLFSVLALLALSAFGLLCINSRSW